MGPTCFTDSTVKQSYATYKCYRLNRKTELWDLHILQTQQRNRVMRPTSVNLSKTIMTFKRPLDRLHIFSISGKRNNVLSKRWQHLLNLIQKWNNAQDMNQIQIQTALRYEETKSQTRKDTFNKNQIKKAKNQIQV